MTVTGEIVKGHRHWLIYTGRTCVCTGCGFRLALTPREAEEGARGGVTLTVVR